MHEYSIRSLRISIQGRNVAPSTICRRRRGLATVFCRPTEDIDRVLVALQVLGHDQLRPRAPPEDRDQLLDNEVHPRGFLSKEPIDGEPFGRERADSTGPGRSERLDDYQFTRLAESSRG